MVMRGGTQRAPWAGQQPQPPPGPPGKPPERKHAGGHPRASPQAVKAVLEALGSGASYTAAAKAGKVSPATARRWWRENRDGEPPGKGSGSGRGHSPITPAQAREALGARLPNGRWEHGAEQAAKTLGVSASALYRALGRDKTSSKEG